MVQFDVQSGSDDDNVPLISGAGQREEKSPGFSRNMSGGLIKSMSSGLLGRDESRGRVHRTMTRNILNVLELNLDQLFAEYDYDSNGYLDIRELHDFLCELHHGEEVSAEEFRWILKMADKDHNNQITKSELLQVYQIWQGYEHMPAEYKNLFEEFDVDEDGLDVNEFRKLLTKLNGGEAVSEMEAQKVMDYASVVGKGKLGKFELMGAVGAWYVSVGREPTPALALAYAAMNHNSGIFHKIMQYGMGIKLCFTVYYPMAAAIGSGPGCARSVVWVLKADAFLWLLMVILVLMKGNWVKVLALLHQRTAAWSFLYRISWGTVYLEMAICFALMFVEALGVMVVLPISRWSEACEIDSKLPVDVWDSYMSGQWKTPDSFFDFSRSWFTGNLIYNAVCVAVYYIWMAFNYKKAMEAEKALHAELVKEGLEKFSSVDDL